MNAVVRTFDASTDRTSLAALWKRVFDYPAPHNDPLLAIEKKLAAGDGLLFVAEAAGKLAGSIMGGYDGHRGWLGYDTEGRISMGKRLIT